MYSNLVKLITVKLFAIMLQYVRQVCFDEGATSAGIKILYGISCAFGTNK